MNKGKMLQFITERQRRWAEAKDLLTANGRVSGLEDNLFAPLHVETRADFEAGDGDEFGIADAVGKMYSLHSSSAPRVHLSQGDIEKRTGLFRSVWHGCLTQRRIA